MADNSGLITDALRRTNQELYNSIDAGNSWKPAITKRGARVALYRNYERGDHRINMTTQMKKMARLPAEDGTELNELCVNYCKVVIDKMAGRLHVANISIDEASETWLQDTLLRNDFDASQAMWWRGAIRDGDSYVMIDPASLMWTSEPAYDGFSGVLPIYNGRTKKPVWACKLWSEADTRDIAEMNADSNVSMNLVVYQPDQISYWKGTENGSEVHEDEKGTVAWKVGRIPIIHFADQADSYTSYGESELRPAIPLQDSLNSTQYDKYVASKLSAFKIYWSKGIALDKDGIVPGSVLNLLVTSTPTADLTMEQIEFLKAVEVGEFGVTDISQYTNQIEKETQQISQVTQTPIYGVTTQGNLSGEALKQLEIGLLGKVERFQRQNSDALKELIELTAAIQNGYNTQAQGKAPKQAGVSVTWKSPEILDVNSRIQTLTQLREKAPGLFTDEWYIERIGGLLGMDKNQIREEIDNAQNQTGLFIDSLVGAGGGVPVA